MKHIKPSDLFIGIGVMENPKAYHRVLEELDSKFISHEEVIEMIDKKRMIHQNLPQTSRNIGITVTLRQLEEELKSKLKGEKI